MLFTVFPPTKIYFFITLFKYTVAIFCIIFILTHIASIISPLINSHTIHFIIHPFSLKESSIFPDISSKTFAAIIFPFSIIYRTIIPLIFPITLFHSFTVFSYIRWAINPCFFSFTMLQVKLPFSFILSSFLWKHSESMGFIVSPITFVNISVTVNVFALAMCFAVAPFSLVTGVIRPYLYTISMAKTSKPFTFINSPCFVSICRSFFFLSFWVK